MSVAPFANADLQDLTFDRALQRLLALDGTTHQVIEIDVVAGLWAPAADLAFDTATLAYEDNQVWASINPQSGALLRYDRVNGVLLP